MAKIKIPVVGSFSSMMGLGVGIFGLWLVFRNKKPPPPELPPPPENGIVVGLMNPPSDATMWSLTLSDWDATTLIDFVGRNGKMLDIMEVATFEIPNASMFSLRVATIQVTKWNEDQTALIQLYHIQSVFPDQPDYREVFIPDYGAYYYNVAKERFE